MTPRRPLITTLAPWLAGLGLAITALAATLPALAQDAAVTRPAGGQLARPLVRLPADRTTVHALALPGRTLHFKATAGSTSVLGPQGAMLADVGFVAYALEGRDPGTRPVVFAFNGGPGSASTWLHLGAMGPWRVPLTVATISGKAPPDLVENAETWLDFADLVFIDPPGTGFSRIWPVAPENAAAPQPQADPMRGRAQRGAEAGAGPERFWSLRGDIDLFAQFVATWLVSTERAASPVVLAGESYGGFRAPLIAEALAGAHAVNVRAMVLISPVLDFDGRRGWRTPMHYVALLPSLAATRLERTGRIADRGALADAEEYARSGYLVDLMKGPRDQAALARIAERLGQLAGLSPEYVVAQQGRLTLGTFIRGSPHTRGQTVSIYDAGMTNLEPVRPERRRGFRDPFTEGLDPPLTEAMHALFGRLGWRADRRYVMLAGEVSQRWLWPNTPQPPQALGALHQLHSKDARLRTLVTHGFTDLVTPYYASAVQLDQLATHGAAQRITLEVYPGGHMFYSRDGSRARFRADAERLIGEALGPIDAQTNENRRETP